MAYTKTQLKALIDEKVEPNNHTGKITGAGVNETLTAMVDAQDDSLWSIAANQLYTCSTAAATAAKTIAATGFTLKAGGSIKIKFEHANSASSPTLNIESTGAKAIYYNGSVASASNTWVDNEVVEFFYNNAGSGSWEGHTIDNPKVSVSQNSETGHTNINIGGVITQVPSLNDIDDIQNLILNKSDAFTTSTRQASSSISGGYSPSGEHISNVLTTYFFNVSEGEIIRIVGNAFGDSGFSIISAWNNDSFVKSLLNSPSQEINFYYVVPSGVNKIGVTYSANSITIYSPIIEFDSAPTENSSKLLTSGTIYKYSVFAGSNPADIDSFSIPQGLWYISANNNKMPFNSAGFLFNQGISGIKQQIAVNLSNGAMFIRVSFNSSWNTWHRVDGLYYKKSILSTDNIDTMEGEGVYYLSFWSDAKPQGTLPSGLTSGAGLLELRGTETIRQQTIFDLGTGYVYVRSGISNYCSWQRLANVNEVLTEEDINTMLNRAFDDIINFVGTFSLKSPDSQITGGFSPTGESETTSLKTYYYNVQEGDLIKIVLSDFPSGGFSVVSAWNDSTFVGSLKNSPIDVDDDDYYSRVFFYRVPSGVNKIAVTYFTNNVYFFTSNFVQVNNRLDSLESVVKSPTRNIWPVASTDVSYDSYIIIGEVGVPLLPAGTYRLSFDLLVENSTHGAEVIAYYLNGGGSVDILHQEKTTTSRKTVTFTASSVIERLFFYFFSSETGNTAQFTNIQLEVIDWNGYTSSPQKGSWAPLPYATPFIDNKSPKDIVSRELKSYWEGKTINYNGDSITQGIGSERTGWVKVVNQILKFGKVNNYAIGGTRLAHPLNNTPEDPNETVNCMVDRYQDMSLDCDIVMIMANTNDYASQVPIGASDSTSPNEYNGALNIIFTWLKENFKTQPIIISTMLTRKDDGRAITIEQYAEAVRERTAAYGFILYDAYKWSGLDLLHSVRDGSGITDDGLHPNEAGALALGRKIAAFINAQ